MPQINVVGQKKIDTSQSSRTSSLHFPILAIQPLTHPVPPQLWLTHLSRTKDDSPDFDVLKPPFPVPLTPPSPPPSPTGSSSLSSVSMEDRRVRSDSIGEELYHVHLRRMTWDERDGSMNPATPEDVGEEVQIEGEVEDEEEDEEDEEEELTTSIFGEDFGGDILTAPLDRLIGASPPGSPGKRKRPGEDDEEGEGGIFERVTRQMAKTRNY